MRRILTFLYRGSGGLAAAFLVLTCGVVVTQVAFNLIGVVADGLFGVTVDLVVPSYADFAGYFFAASAFLGLGYVHHCGAHIRVTILMDRTRGRGRAAVEIWCLCVAVFLAGYFTCHAFALVRDSYRFNDLSVGLVAVPLWLPQMAMGVGALVVTIALFDDLVTVVAGHVRRGLRQRGSAPVARSPMPRPRAAGPV